MTPADRKRSARPETTAAKRQRERTDRRSTGAKVYDRRGPRVSARHLPVVVETPPVTHLVPTRGERRLCAHESACLEGHIAAHRHADTPASCKPDCRWWAPVQLEVSAYRNGAGALAHVEPGGWGPGDRSR